MRWGAPSPRSATIGTTGAHAGTETRSRPRRSTEIRRSRRHPVPPQKDYLHLRALLRDLAAAMRSLPAGRRTSSTSSAGRRPTATCSRRTCDTSGMDVDRRYGVPDVESTELLPFDDASFDVVLCIEGFHYVREPEHGVDEMRRVLRPGGWAIMTVPLMWEYDRATFESRYTGHDLARLFEDWDDVEVVENGGRGVTWATVTGDTVDLLEQGLVRRLPAARVARPALRRDVPGHQRDRCPDRARRASVRAHDLRPPDEPPGTRPTAVTDDPRRVGRHPDAQPGWRHRGHRRRRARRRQAWRSRCSSSTTARPTRRGRGLCARASDPRLRPLAPRRATAGSRRRGTPGSRQRVGDWVAFLDDDDLWSPDKLATQLDAMTRVGADWSWTGVVLVDDRRVALRDLPAPPPDGSSQAPRRSGVRDPSGRVERRGADGPRAPRGCVRRRVLPARRLGSVAASRGGGDGGVVRRGARRLRPSRRQHAADRSGSAARGVRAAARQARGDRGAGRHGLGRAAGSRAGWRPVIGAPVVASPPPRSTSRRRGATGARATSYAPAQRSSASERGRRSTRPAPIRTRSRPTGCGPTTGRRAGACAPARTRDDRPRRTGPRGARSPGDRHPVVAAVSALVKPTAKPARRAASATRRSARPCG